MRARPPRLLLLLRKIRVLPLPLTLIFLTVPLQGTALASRPQRTAGNSPERDRWLCQHRLPPSPPATTLRRVLSTELKAPRAKNQF